MVNKYQIVQLKEKITLIKEAANLLKIKRDKLIDFLIKKLKEINQKRKEIQKSLEEGKLAIKYAIAIEGENKLIMTSISSIVNSEKSEKNLLGFKYSELFFNENLPEISLSPVIYFARKKFKDIVENILPLEYEYEELDLLIKEVFSLNTKINALEKIILPKYSNTLKELNDKILQENLENIEMLKKAKEIMYES